MAHRISLIDDLDGTPLTPGRGGTITFSLDNDVYEIDLRPANAAQLHRALTPYITAARRTDTSSTTPRHRVTTLRASAGRKSPETLAAIRHWATRHGHTVPRSGRIPTDVQDAYDAAH
ncbi:Lsr2 family protein [Rathayibacter festucae]|uniref:histone-like nucleoid-structuring protein Lsr2 n=1 Tax=Rathayibacter festucae TaxID=110937 RepID=UPI001FB29DE9|nr:Lsr2 family protein [Rathayibacter festucae]MCJ1702116.1 Lsr2 family protein [Rathayibacter festucae]